MSRFQLGFGLIACIVTFACGDDGDDERVGTTAPCKPSMFSCDIEDEDCAQSVLELTACLREDDVPPLPEIRLQTAAQAVERLKQDIDPADLEPTAWDRVLPKLSLLPAGESSADAAIEQFIDTVAAFYHIRDNDVTILTDAESAGDVDERMYVLSHEFTHYLQDRAADLGALRDSAEGSTDRAVALDGLVEGEAVVVSTRALIRWTGRSVEAFSWERFFAGFSDSLFETVSRSRSPLMAAMQLMPYAVGGDYVSQVWELQGREGVDDLFEAVPEAFVDWMADPEDLRLGETLVEPLDCAPPLAPAGFRLDEVDRFGAAGVFALSSALGEADFALAAALRNDAIALYVTESADEPARAPALAVWRMRFADTRSASHMVSLLNGAGLREDTRRANTEVWVRVGSDAGVTALRGPALEACPAFDELEPQRTTPSTPSEAVHRLLRLSRPLPKLR